MVHVKIQELSWTKLIWEKEQAHQCTQQHRRNLNRMNLVEILKKKPFYTLNWEEWTFNMENMYHFMRQQTEDMEVLETQLKLHHWQIQSLKNIKIKILKAFWSKATSDLATKSWLTHISQQHQRLSLTKKAKVIETLLFRLRKKLLQAISALVDLIINCRSCPQQEISSQSHLLIRRNFNHQLISLVTWKQITLRSLIIMVLELLKEIQEHIIRHCIRTTLSLLPPIIRIKFALMLLLSASKKWWKLTLILGARLWGSKTLLSSHQPRSSLIIHQHSPLLNPLTSLIMLEHWNTRAWMCIKVDPLRNQVPTTMLLIRALHSSGCNLNSCTNE
jgi:hypothetical protein